MEIEVREFGVRIRLIIEPDTGNNVKETKTTEIETSAVEIEVEKEPVQKIIQRPELERALRNWRREEAVRRGVPTYIIMTERTILSIVAEPPTDLEHLQYLKGIGPKTMELYGENLLNIISDTEKETEEE
jgi:ATP-dependent DNA helicase RecQ